MIDLYKGDALYDCNIPPDIDGYRCYEKMIKISRVEVIGKNEREFCKNVRKWAL